MYVLLQAYIYRPVGLYIHDNAGRRLQRGVKQSQTRKFVNERNTSACTVMLHKRDCLVQSAYLSTRASACTPT